MERAADRTGVTTKPGRAGAQSDREAVPTQLAPANIEATSQWGFEHDPPLRWPVRRHLHSPSNEDGRRDKDRAPSDGSRGGHLEPAGVSALCAWSRRRVPALLQTKAARRCSHD